MKRKANDTRCRFPQHLMQQYCQRGRNIYTTKISVLVLLIREGKDKLEIKLLNTQQIKDHHKFD